MSSAKSVGGTKSARRLRAKPVAAAPSVAVRGAKTKSSAELSLATARRVLRIEAEAIAGLIDRLDERFERAVELLHACSGRVVVTGLGKSGLIGRKIAATFASTGSPSFFLHAAEALHGDLGMLTASDVLLAISSSGETEELVELLEAVKRLGVHLITLTAAPSSTLASASDIVLDIAVKEEACSLNLAPTASTAAALAMGDALAIALLERRGFSEDDFAALHPGGKLGKKLRRVEALMHTGENLPRVLPDTKMPDVIYEMSRKGLGPGSRHRTRWPPARHHHRRRPPPCDAEAPRECSRPVCCGLPDEESRHAAALGTCRRGSALDGRKENHVRAHCRRSKTPRRRRPYP